MKHLLAVHVAITLGAVALGACAAYAAPEADLKMTFSSEDIPGTPGSIVGTIRNTSDRAYPCVDADFKLVTHFSDRQAGAKQRNLGTQTVRFRNLAAGETRPFQTPLQEKAGFGFGGYTLCAPLATGEIKLPPRGGIKPQISKTCKVHGKIASTQDFKQQDDQRQTWEIEDIAAFDRDSRETAAVSRVPGNTTNVTDHRSGKSVSYKQRSYTLSGLHEGRRFAVGLSQGFRTEPRSLDVTCPDAQGRYEFGLPTLFHPRKP